jgi:hypothetical protein
VNVAKPDRASSSGISNIWELLIGRIMVLETTPKDEVYKKEPPAPERSVLSVVILIALVLRLIATGVPNPGIDALIGGSDNSLPEPLLLDPGLAPYCSILTIAMITTSQVGF